jgi:uncharacterized lipoprotein YajG
MFRAFPGLQIFAYTLHCEFQRERKYRKRMTLIMLIFYGQIHLQCFRTMYTAHNEVKIILSGIYNSCKNSSVVYKRGCIKTFRVIAQPTKPKNHKNYNIPFPAKSGYKLSSWR